MILTSLHVDAFRSVKEPLTLAIEPNVTILIGANDHGKTGLLEAIRSLNDDRSITAEDENWDCLGTNRLMVTHEMILDDEEAAWLQEHRNELPTANTLANIAGLRAAKIAFTRKAPQTPLDITIKNKPITHEPTRNYLLERRPRVELFANAEQLMDVITLQGLEDPTQEFMQGIFRYAELWEHRTTLFNQTPATARRLENASASFTERIRKEWQQGDQLTFKFHHAGSDGNKIELLIRDPAVNDRFVRPSERSEGFSTFFKLAMRLRARTDTNKAQRYLFLFDEPGTALHPSGQINLQRVFERLAQQNQIIYATHSLFMINHNRPERSRVIHKGAKGTVVNHKPYLGNWRAAKEVLGLLFAGNFFIANTTLLVEGESDALYIGALLAALDRANIIDCDLNLFSVKWAGNAKDVEPMARLMIEEGRSVVALLDGDKGGDELRKALERLNTLISEGRVLARTPVRILQLERHQSIEDLLPNKETYYDAVIQTATELIQGGFRQPADGLNVDPGALRNLLTQDKGTLTLGKHVEKITKQWFKPFDAVSKLAVAARYCSATEKTPPTLGQAPPILVELTGTLNLESKTSDPTILATPRETGTATTVATPPTPDVQLRVDDRNGMLVVWLHNDGIKPTTCALHLTAFRHWSEKHQAFRDRTFAPIELIPQSTVQPGADSTPCTLVRQHTDKRLGAHPVGGATVMYDATENGAYEAILDLIIDNEHRVEKVYVDWVPGANPQFGKHPSALQIAT